MSLLTSMPVSYLALVTCATLLVLLSSIARWKARTRGRPLPPGPKGLPFFGNVTDLRKGRPWMIFNELRARYGASIALHIVMANIWACMHDPETYQDPDTFEPERFIRDGKLDPNVRDPYEFVFGFGRRICPGRYFDDAALFINLAVLLHVFDITPPVDADGQDIKVEPRMADSVVSRPEDSRCTIKARGPWAEALICISEPNSSM
ncbi:cytochrome P450 [Cerioporus squamosus]|nr:cytochrome P450 [Cerioporus squamosus]